MSGAILVRTVSIAKRSALFSRKAEAQSSHQTRSSRVRAMWADDDPIAAALAGKAPAIVAIAAGTSPGISSAPSTSSAQRQQMEDERYDTATIMLEKAMESHAALAAAKARIPDSPNNYYCAVVCCEARAGACACRLGEIGFGRYRDCLCCRCLKAPSCQTGGLLAAPTPQIVVR